MTKTKPKIETYGKRIKLSRKVRIASIILAIGLFILGAWMVIEHKSNQHESLGNLQSTTTDLTTANMDTFYDQAANPKEALDQEVTESIADLLYVAIILGVAVAPLSIIFREVRGAGRG